MIIKNETKKKKNYNVQTKGVLFVLTPQKMIFC